MAKKIKVLVVDQSPKAQGLLTRIVNADCGMDVIGVASDPYIAREKIKQLEPDVLTLDVNLPKMDGITFLRNLMRLRPMPVIMVISDDSKSKIMTEAAQKIGAQGIFLKSTLIGGSSAAKDINLFLARIRKAADAKQSSILGPKECHSADVILQPALSVMYKSTEALIAIGASTGGTEAIQSVLMELPAQMPAIVITQHIPGKFSNAFAERINKLSKLNVSEAVNGERILPGHVYIAPGDQHLLVECKNSGYVCALHDGPPVNRHKPSVDVLFRSVAQVAGPNGVGVLLTGMGNDGAAGLLEMKKANARTIAQDEATSVVWGMPGSAVKCGAVDDISPLDEMVVKIIEAIKMQGVTDKVKDFVRLRRLNR